MTAPKEKLTRRELAILKLIVEDHIESERLSQGSGIPTAERILAKLTAAIPIEPLAGLEAPVRRLPVANGVEAYPLDAHIWRRDSTGEWVLEISGAINDTSFVNRHTEPLTTKPENVAGLPSLYASVLDTTHIPPMPETADRRPYDEETYPGYMEGNRDWADNNDEAVTWLADNHAAIRALLAGKATS